MKNLRQYIRKILIESANTIHPKIKSMLDELEENYGEINIQNYPNQGQLVEIRFYAGAQHGDRYYNTGVGGGSDAGAVFAMYSKDSVVPSMSTKIGNCNGAVPIGGVDGSQIAVEYGFGPLLYDVLFDAAVMLSGATGLTCDYYSVSDEAYNVWNYYLKNRPDMIAKQKDLTQYPRTPDESDDCTGPGAGGSFGYRSVAKRFGFDKSYGVKASDKDGMPVRTGELTPEFIDHWFDPENPLSKTYHRKSGGTPVIDYLRSNFLLNPKAAKVIGQPYSPAELKKVWDRTIGIEEAGYPDYMAKKAKQWQQNFGANAEDLLA